MVVRGRGEDFIIHDNQKSSGVTERVGDSFVTETASIFHNGKLASETGALSASFSVRKI
jgi:hypothetical protein